MDVKRRAHKRKSERMSDFGFRMMVLTFKLVDFFFHSRIDRQIKEFGLGEGLVVVDYGCGPGRYTTRFARIVGQTGQVYAVDIHELAIEAVQKKVARERLQNVVAVLARGYDSTLPDHVADVVCALDMFFAIRQPTEFLAELKRVIKPEGILVIDDGHQPRAETKEKIQASGHWTIVEETRDHVKCKPA